MSSYNNVNPHIPALMSDGRNYTNYDSACELNEALKSSLGFENNYEYRQYMIKYGNQIKSQNLKSHTSTLYSWNNVNNSGNDKYLYKSTSDNSEPYGYESSDMKEMYLSRQQLQSRMSGPILSQEDLLRLSNMPKKQKN